MKQFISVHDAGDLKVLLNEAMKIKADVNACATLGKQKTPFSVSNCCT